MGAATSRVAVTAAAFVEIAEGVGTYLIGCRNNTVLLHGADTQPAETAHGVTVGSLPVSITLTEATDKLWARSDYGDASVDVIAVTPAA
jgi:hypothetical protein